LAFVTSGLKGAPEFKHRLEATKGTFGVGSRAWASEAASIMRSSVATKTGKTRRSFGTDVDRDSAVVTGASTAYLIDAGSPAHPIKPRGRGVLAYGAGRNRRFARKVDHPGHRAKPFRVRAMEEAYRRHGMADAMVGLWNGAE
jgi:hypothetical protein